MVGNRCLCDGLLPPMLAALTSLHFLQQALIALPKGCCSLSIHAHFKHLSIQWKSIKDQSCFSHVLTFSKLSCVPLSTSNLKLHSTTSTRLYFQMFLTHLLNTSYVLLYPPRQCIICLLDAVRMARSPPSMPL